jgi:hypothetical protein
MISGLAHAVVAAAALGRQTRAVLANIAVIFSRIQIIAGAAALLMLAQRDRHVVMETVSAARHQSLVATVHASILRPMRITAAAAGTNVSQISVL